MTGFGRGEASAGAPLVAEVRSVNGRHLDLRVRLPRELAALEPTVRQSVAGRFSRGKVDLLVRAPEGSPIPAAVAVDDAVARRYVEAARDLRERFDLAGEVSIETLLSLPGVVRLRESEGISEEIVAALVVAVERGCDAAVEMREREGKALEAEITRRLAQVTRHVGAVEERANEIQNRLRERLRRRLESLAPEVGIDPGRLDQELVFYADRLDVTEEIVRLRSHLAQFRDALSGEEPVGRKLEFLLQELSREINTLGAKIADADVAGQVVQIKTELERLREQILNVE